MKQKLLAITLVVTSIANASNNNRSWIRPIADVAANSTALICLANPGPVAQFINNALNPIVGNVETPLNTMIQVIGGAYVVAQLAQRTQLPNNVATQEQLRELQETTRQKMEHATMTLVSQAQLRELQETIKQEMDHATMTLVSQAQLRDYQQTTHKKLMYIQDRYITRESADETHAPKGAAANNSTVATPTISGTGTKPPFEPNGYGTQAAAAANSTIGTRSETGTQPLPDPKRNSSKKKGQ